MKDEEMKKMKAKSRRNKMARAARAKRNSTDQPRRADKVDKAIMEDAAAELATKLYAVSKNVTAIPPGARADLFNACGFFLARCRAAYVTEYKAVATTLPGDVRSYAEVLRKEKRA